MYYDLWSQYLHKSVETIQGRKLYEEIWYSKKLKITFSHRVLVRFQRMMDPGSRVVHFDIAVAIDEKWNWINKKLDLSSTLRKKIWWIDVRNVVNLYTYPETQCQPDLKQQGSNLQAAEFKVNLKKNLVKS